MANLPRIYLYSLSPDDLFFYTPIPNPVYATCWTISHRRFLSFSTYVLKAGSETWKSAEADGRFSHLVADLIFANVHLADLSPLHRLVLSSCWLQAMLQGLVAAGS